MSNLEVGVRLTADGRGLIGEAGRAREAIGGLGGEQRKASADSAAYTAQIERQNASLNAMKTAAIAAAAGIASLKVGQLVGEMASLSQRYQELGIILNVAGRNAGISAGEIDKTTEAVRKSGITMLQSRQAVTSMIQANIDLSQATKLARLAQDAAVVGQINSSEALDKLIYGLSTAQIEVLKTMGLTVNFERAYKKLADQLGKTTQELTDQERMQARLNTVYESGANIVGAYEGAMNNAGKQLRSTERQVEDLKVVVGGLFDETSKLAVSAYTDVLKTLTSEAETLTSNGDILRWGDNIAHTFAVAGDAARAAFSPILILLKTVDSAIARGSALASGDFAKSRQIGADFDKFLKAELDVLTGSTKLQDALQKQLVARDLLTEAVGRGAKALQTEAGAMTDNAASGDKSAKSIKEREKAAKVAQREAEKAAKAREREAQQAVDASNRVIESLKRETDEVGKSAIQKRLMAAASEAAKAPTQELAQEIMASAQAWAMATQAQDDAIANNRQMQEAATARQRAETQAAQAVQQEWNQTWSTVESTARISFTQFAAHGVGAMEAIGKSIKNGIIDLLYQLTVRKWIINIGASLGLAGGTGSALAEGGGGIGSALNIASMGSGALNLLKTGFGATSLLSSAGSMLPGAAGSFFAGMGVSGTQAAAAAGAQTLWGASGMGAAASAGSAFAAAAGPAIAVAAVDQIVRMLAGDKMLGGGVGKVLNFVPVLGPLINGLFGRGPLKQRETTLSGTIGAQGFIDGSLNTDFRAAGGLFRSNKNDFARVDAVTGEISTDNNKLLDYANQLSTVAKDVIGLVNDTTTQVGSSLKQIGADLALSTEGLDNFSHSIELVSEKGKMLTDEQIAEEIGNISDKMARSLLPNLDEFAKRGETALQTVGRLGLEFATLAEGVSVIFGQSGQAAKDIVNRFSIGDRTEFIDAAGGIEAFSQKINQFFSNLDDSDKLTILEDRLKTALNEVGVNFIPTMDQFNDAMRSAAITPKLFIEGLNLQGLIKDVNDLRTSVGGVSSAVDNLIDASTELPERLNYGLANAQSQERIALETRLLQLQGDTAALRQLELDALDPANRALLEHIHLLEDQQSANEIAARVAQEHYSLESQLLQLQGDTAALRQRELDALDPANRAIQLRIFALQDEATKADALKRNLTDAVAAFDRQVSSERNSIETHFRGLMSAVDESIRAATSSVSNLQSVVDSLRGDINNIAGMSISDAQSQIRAEIIGARSGNVIDLGRVRDAISTISGRDDSGFSTREEMLRAQAGDAKLLMDLSDVAMSQLSAAEDSIGLLEEQKILLEQQLENEITALNRISENTKAQVDAITGVGESIRSMLGNKSPLVQSISAMSQSVMSLARAARADSEIPKFAAGGRHVGGLRIVGERGPELEATGPAMIYNSAQLRQMMQQPSGKIVVDIKEIEKKLEENTATIRKLQTILDRVTRGEDAIYMKQA